MSSPDNNDRAEWAEHAVREFRDVCGGSPLTNKEGWSEAIGDLVGNICHLAKAKGLDPAALIQHGLSHYAVEAVDPDGMFMHARATVTIEAKPYSGSEAFQELTPENLRRWRKQAKAAMAG
jgi:hypothetical protein